MSERWPWEMALATHDESSRLLPVTVNAPRWRSILYIERIIRIRTDCVVSVPSLGKTTTDARISEAKNGVHHFAPEHTHGTLSLLGAQYRY